MFQNVGLYDRLVRALVAALAGYVYYIEVMIDHVNILVALAGIILLMTALLGIDPFYMAFNLSTRKATRERRRKRELQ